MGFISVPRRPHAQPSFLAAPRHAQDPSQNFTGRFSTTSGCKGFRTSGTDLRRQVALPPRSRFSFQSSGPRELFPLLPLRQSRPSASRPPRNSPVCHARRGTVHEKDVSIYGASTDRFLDIFQEASPSSAHSSNLVATSLNTQTAPHPMPDSTVAADNGRAMPRSCFEEEPYACRPHVRTFDDKGRMLSYSTPFPLVRRFCLTDSRHVWSNGRRIE